MITAPALENLTFSLTQETRIKASLEDTFEALLEQMGPANETPDGTPLPMKIEPRPGGRWYRDLSGDNGHLWGHVQSIKRPTLLEVVGPLFMSYPAVNNVQYRLTEVPGGTLLVFKHTALGFLLDEHRSGLSDGWKPLHERIKRVAELRTITREKDSRR
jgi:uncharacterized protein YndB with AHSA1/START domain